MSRMLISGGGSSYLHGGTHGWVLSGNRICMFRVEKGGIRYLELGVVE